MLRDIEKGISLAITIIGCIVSGMGIGYCADSLIGSTPMFMIVGIFVGTGLAFWYLFQWAKK